MSIRRVLVVSALIVFAAGTGQWKPYEGNPVLGNAKLGTCSGEKSFRFNPDEVFGAGAPTVMKNFGVKIETVPTAYPTASEVLYKIVDLDEERGLS